MALLVTGGAGYVGSHTVRMLVEHGRQVVVLDSMECGHRSAVTGADLVVGDVRDIEVVRRLVRDFRVDGVIHFAGYKAPGESMSKPHRYFDNNVSSTLQLLEVLAQENVRRIVFSSSCAVYGAPTDLPVRESHPLTPQSPYGESKQIVEQMLKWFDVCHDVHYVSLRYFNAAGASLDARIGEDWTATANLVPLAMKAALRRRPPLQVFGTDYPTRDGTAIRDYVHVVDLAAAHIKSIEYLEGGGFSSTLNLGTGQASSVFEVVRCLERVSQTSVPVDLAERRVGDPPAIWADNGAARELLGWIPRFDLDDIVRTAWLWHSTHIDGYAADTFSAR